MLLALLTLISGLAISAVAIYYSVQGLAAIFAAAVIPIVIMGTILEVSKLVTAWWLKANWHRAPLLLKSYMLIAVVVLMLITSMGIFGFLSKAHTDQVIPAGDVVSQVALFDEKIQNERNTIEDARRLLKQLDDAVVGIQSGEGREVRNRDGSSRIENPAERALQVRRAQARDRDALTKTINEAQARIVQIQEQKAPIAGQLRALEAEVGPIKYIAALIYGDNPDANLLEKAVTWVIMVIVFVFDPLAVLLLLASQLSFQWHRQDLLKPKYEQDDGPLTNDQIDQIKESAANDEIFDDTKEVDEFFQQGKLIARGLDADEEARLAEEANALIAEIEREVPEVILPNEVETTQEVIVEEPAEEIENPDDDENEDFDEVSETEKAAMARWKAAHPGKSVKFQRKLLARGIIDQLPWQVEAIEITEDEAAQEAVKWASEQIEESKKKTVTWIEKNGPEQIKQIREQ